MRSFTKGHSFSVLGLCLSWIFVGGVSGLHSSVVPPSRRQTGLQATSSETSEGAGATSATRRVSLLVCPAQFCVPDDYTVLFDNLRSLDLSTLITDDDDDDDDDDKDDATTNIEIGTTVVAPLPRTEWIKVAKQLPTRNFWDATLPVHQTLDWYFQAMEKGLSDILAQEGPEANICIVGHSIGGWVARAYLGGLSRSSSAVSQIARERVSSLVTLGTPHVSPDSALVDQTRGLLQEIADAPSCSSESLMKIPAGDETKTGMSITCVCSSSLSGDFITSNVEQLVAASSYLPLLGKVGKEVAGDGIVPLELASMEAPARRVTLNECQLTGAPIRHSHVLPTPWNLWDGYAPSLSLPEDFVSYVSEGVLPQWAMYIK